MAKKNVEFTEKEIAHIEKLRRHPKLKERFEAMLEIGECQEGRLLNADEAEGLLVEEVRKLGATGVAEWAKSAEELIGREHREKHPEHYCGKQSPELVDGVRKD